MATKTETYELKDKSTTFFDPETKFKVTADQQVQIDANARKGKLTLAAINAGGLVAVDSKAAKAAADTKATKDKEK
jgi:hypothetical protein